MDWLDVTLSLVVVALAAAAVVMRLVAIGRDSTPPDDAQGEGSVTVGPSLKRGLDRVRRQRDGEKERP